MAKKTSPSKRGKSPVKKSPVKKAAIKKAAPKKVGAKKAAPKELEFSDPWDQAKHLREALDLEWGKGKASPKKGAAKRSLPKKASKSVAAPKKAAAKKTAPKTASQPTSGKGTTSIKSQRSLHLVKNQKSSVNPAGKPTDELGVSPLRDYVLIRREGEATRTAGGLYIPETAKERPAQGTVVSVGHGSWDKKGRRQILDVKAGDRILFGKWSGTEVTVGGEELVIMKESEILGVLD